MDFLEKIWVCSGTYERDAQIYRQLTVICTITSHERDRLDGTKPSKTDSEDQLL